MTILYFDTSAIVPAFVREVSTERVLSLIAARDGAALAISGWVLTEFSSALAIKLHSGAISAELFATAHTEWRLFCQSVRLLPIGEHAFREAAAICQRHDLGLRAGDALHLAVAASHGCALVTLDERMATAARKLAVTVAGF